MKAESGGYNVPFLDLSRQTAELGGELERAVAAVLRDGRFVLGEPVERFEREFAAHCGGAHAVGVASGTDALAIALQAVGVGPGDEVVTAANTCVPTVAAIESAGAVPVLVDVVQETFTLDPAALEAAVGARTRAIVPVHLYGQCAEMAPIVGFARERGLKVVEDAAQGHGSEYAGRRAGTLGDAAAFSFYPTKNLGAGGDGGAVVTNDADVAARARRLRSFGEGAGRVAVERGRNSRLDALQATLLSVKLARLDVWNTRRRALARRYLDALSGSGLELPAEAAGRRHVYHLFVVRTPSRDALRATLGERGIETMIHYPRPVHLHPAYVSLARELPVSERLSDEILSLPLYPQLSDGEADAVCEAVVEAAVPA